MTTSPASEFVWKANLPACHAPEAEKTAKRLARWVAAACHSRFPGATYCHRRGRDGSAATGHRFEVTREGFHGVISVRWFASAHSYRRASAGSVHLRIDGCARAQPVCVDASSPIDEHAQLRALGLCFAAIAFPLGWFGLGQITSAPSVSGMINAVGYACCLLLITAAVLVFSVALQGIKWERISLRRLARALALEHRRDVSRWRALGRELTQVLPQVAVLDAK